MAFDGSNLVGLTWRHNKTSFCALNQTILSGFKIYHESTVCFKVNMLLAFIEKRNYVGVLIYYVYKNLISLVYYYYYYYY
jgi:hypothetical protein